MKVEVMFGRHAAIPGNRYTQGYAYECPWTVNVGDIILLPGNSFRSEPQEATVTRIGTDYEGECAEVQEVVEHVWPLPQHIRDGWT